MLNKVQIIGRLGDAVTLRHTQNGKAVANFSLATSQKGPTGQEQVEWHKIIVWEKQAENCAQYLAKGKLCYVEGRLATRSYDKNGQKLFTTEIIASQVQFLSPKEETAQPAAAPVFKQNEASTPNQRMYENFQKSQPKSSFEPQFAQDEIPF